MDVLTTLFSELAGLALLVSQGLLAALALILLLPLIEMTLALVEAAWRGAQRVGGYDPDAGTPYSLYPQDRPPSLVRRWLRRFAWLSVSLILALALAGRILNSHYFEPMIRRAMGHIGERMAADCTFDDVSGSLWQGDLRLTEFRLKSWENARDPRFSLAADELAVRLDLRSLLWQQPRFTRVSLDGLQAEILRGEPAAEMRHSQAYAIDRLELTDAQVRIAPRATGPAVTVEIPTWQTRSFRSRLPWYDLLFQSAGVARLGTCQLQLEPATPELAGSVVRWQIDQLPVDLLREEHTVPSPREGETVNLRGRFTPFDARHGALMLYLVPPSAEKGTESARLSRSEPSPEEPYSTHSTEIDFNASDFHRRSTLRATPVPASLREILSPEPSIAQDQAIGD